MRLVPILAITCSVLAALSALIIFSAALLVPALVAFVSGVFLVLRKDRPGFAMGGAAIVLSIMGMLGSLGSVGLEGGSVDFGIQESLGHAIVIIALLAVPAGLLWANWDAFDSSLAIGAAADLGIAAILAVAFQDSLSDQTTWQAFIVALLAFAAVLPGALALRME